MITQTKVDVALGQPVFSQTCFQKLISLLLFLAVHITVIDFFACNPQSVLTKLSTIIPAKRHLSQLKRISSSFPTQLAGNWQGTGRGNWQGTGTQLVLNWQGTGTIKAL